MKKNYLNKTILSIAITLFCLNLSFGQTETCPANMTHYWPLDEGTGSGPYIDLFGNNADCSADVSINCPDPISITNPIGANAQNFFNSNSFGIDIPDDGTYDWGAGDSFSIAFWMQSGTSLTSNQVILARDDRASETIDAGIHMWIGIEGDAGDGTANDGTVRFQLRDRKNDPVSPYLGGVGKKINDDMWHLIVAVRDESVNENRIYVDGQLVDSEGFDYTDGWASSAPMTIGHLNSGIPGSFFYNGNIDEIAIFNGALTQPEIANHYNVGINNKLGYCALAPVFTSVAVTSGKVGSAYFYDADISANPTATFSLQNSPPTGMTIDAATGEINWTPITGQEGNQSIRVQATNALGSTIQDFTINVLLENEPPTFTKGADQVTEEDSGEQIVAGWATNIDDGDDNATQIVTFNIKNNSDASLFASGPTIDGETGDLTYTPAADANGTATITIDLSDAGTAVSAEQSFDITITPVNDAPTFVIGADQSEENDVGLTIIQNWATSINDGDPGPAENQVLTFEISGNNNVGLFADGPNINVVGDLSFTPMDGTSGVANITVILKDDGSGVAPNINASAEQTFNITIEMPVGITKEDISKSLRIFPNPSTNDLLNLRLENEVTGDFRIDVFALNGKSLYTDSFVKRNAVFEHQINVDNLPQGIFLLRILNDKFIAEKRIIIE